MELFNCKETFFAEFKIYACIILSFVLYFIQHKGVFTCGEHSFFLCKNIEILLILLIITQFNLILLSETEVLV